MYAPVGFLLMICVMLGGCATGGDSAASLAFMRAGQSDRQRSALLISHKYSGGFGPHQDPSMLMVALWSDGLIVWGDRKESARVQYSAARIHSAELDTIVEAIDELELLRYASFSKAWPCSSWVEITVYRSRKPTRYVWNESLSTIGEDDATMQFVDSWRTATNYLSSLRPPDAVPLQDDAEALQVFQRDFPGWWETCESEVLSRVELGSTAGGESDWKTQPPASIVNAGGRELTGRP